MSHRADTWGVTHWTSLRLWPTRPVDSAPVRDPKLYIVNLRTEDLIRSWESRMGLVFLLLVFFCWRYVYDYGMDVAGFMQ